MLLCSRLPGRVTTTAYFMGFFKKNVKLIAQLKPHFP